jgi:ParB family chromosome partitioning protein
MRLLKLPAQIQMALKNREIDMGHARALLALDSPSLQLKLFKEVQKNQYSVRKVEEMVQALKNGEDVQTARKRITTRVPLSSSLNESKNRLTSMLNTKVQLTCSPKGSGKISIAFANEEDLNRIMSLLER